MSRNRFIRASLLSATVLAAAVLGTAGAANATTTASVPNDNFQVTSLSKFALRPQVQGGYLGEITVKVTYVGTNPDGTSFPAINIMPPKGLNFAWSDEQIEACTTWFPSTCNLGGQFKPGETRTVKIGFEGYAAPRSFARLASDGWVNVHAYETTPGPRATAQFNGVLASTSGSTRNPRPYAPSGVFDMTASAGPITVTKGVDGRWQANTDLTVRYLTDKVNYGGELYYALPGGVAYPDEPADVMCMDGWCELPGSTVYERTVRTFRFSWTFEADTPPGAYTGYVRVAADDNEVGEPTDVTPEDNTVSLTVTIP